MGNVTRSNANNISSPNGNSLALFVDGETGEMRVKDVLGNVQNFSEFNTSKDSSSPFKLNTNLNGIEPKSGANYANGRYSTIGGGKGNTASGYCSTIGGGHENIASGYSSVIGGGYKNKASGCVSTIGGGYSNVASDFSATVGGGNENNASGYVSTISGGRINCASGDFSAIIGGSTNVSSGVFSIVNGGRNNTASGYDSIINGGSFNTASGTLSIISGGLYNVASCYASIVSGGQCNIASQVFSTISGGRYNINSSAYAVISGGYRNNTSGYYAIIGGGKGNTASGCSSIIVGGKCNTASGSYSSILGGKSNNTYSFDYAMIVGTGIQATQACTTFMNCASIENLTEGCTVVVGNNKVLKNANFNPNKGLFAQTADSTPITGTIIETSLISTGVGTLTVPANGFSLGNSFDATLEGTISAIGTAKLFIKVKTLDGTILTDIQIAMEATTLKAWSLELNFTIRTLGIAGEASISSSGLFSYIKKLGTNFEGVSVSTINSTTFDTTISNTLVITAQWDTNNAGNSIFSRDFILNQIF